MAHTIGGYSIVVTDDDISQQANIAELDVIDSTSTTVQHFSKPSQRRTITGYVFTDANRLAIEQLSSGSAAANYTSDQGSQGNYYIKNATSKRIRGMPVGFSGVSSTATIYLMKIQMVKA